MPRALSNMVRGLQDQPQHCDLAVDRLDSVQSAALIRLSDGQLAAQNRPLETRAQTCESSHSPAFTLSLVCNSCSAAGLLHGARGRRWIDCYCDAGEATQRRAAFYPLQRHGKSARATLY